MEAYQGTEIIPHLRNIGVEAYCTGICIKGIPILVDLVIKDTNRAPERGVAAISINGLLVGFVGL